MTALNKQAQAIISDIRQKRGSGDVYAPIIRWDEFEVITSALEAAEKHIEEEVCRANREHHRGFMMACNHLKEHANVHYADAAEMEIAALRQRIAELEARAFKVEMPESFYPDGDIEVPLVLQEHEVIAAIVAAGGMPIAICRRCKSELDLSHRPDGSHYCHAPDAGIGVKGE
jgi:hypothetical protein